VEECVDLAAKGGGETGWNGDVSVGIAAVVRV
jgi:hypothetical protein